MPPPCTTDRRDFTVGSNQVDALLGADEGGDFAEKMQRLTGMPIAIGRTRSVTDTMEAALSPGSNSFITW